MNINDKTKSIHIGTYTDILCVYIYMGKLEYFTNLNYGHLGMISRINYASRVRENSEVVIIYPDI